MTCVLCVQQSGPSATAGDSVPRVGSRANRVQRVCACGPVLHARRCVTLTDVGARVVGRQKVGRTLHSENHCSEGISVIIEITGLGLSYI